MTGFIKTVYYYSAGGISYIFIAGDDGKDYFGHNREFVHKSKHYVKGRKVSFDVMDSGKSNPEAVNIDVEIPINPTKQDELVSVEHLPDGAYVKRVIKPSGEAVSLIIKDGKLQISALSAYEKDMIWMYRRSLAGA